MIPMVDLKTQYLQLKQEIDQNIMAVLNNTQFIGGPIMQAFEQAAADYLEIKHAMGVANGSDALILALTAAGIGPGDEVITTSFSFIATATAILHVGATPIFVDVDPNTFNIDLNQVNTVITNKTRAIIPVHIFGQAVNMPELCSLTKDKNIIIIEDCAQSFGAAINGKKTGTFGLIGTYSFYPSKTLGCYGDGGMVITNDDTIAKKISMLRSHGSEVRYHHDMLGFNSRLDEIQAAILSVKLKYLEQHNQKRYQIAQRYTDGLQNIPTLQTPIEDKIGQHVYHQYTLLSPQRDLILSQLKNANIGHAIHYPIPLHQQKVFTDRCGQQSLPISERICQQCFSIPIYPELTQQQVTVVIDTIRHIFA
jgi:dTDP-4-amino-4,6-dideoxygalactose transaminase